MAERFYYVGNDQITLQPSTAFVAVKRRMDADRSAVAQAVARTAGIETLEVGEELDPFDIVLVPTVRDAQAATVEASNRALAQEESIEGTLPVFQIPDGASDEVMILTPQFRVQFKPEVNTEAIDAFNQQHKVEVIAGDDLEPNNYLLRPMASSDKDALDLANLYHESDLTEYAEPDWVYQVKKLDVSDSEALLSRELSVSFDEVEHTNGHAVEPAPADVEHMAPVNDPHFPDQWALSRMRVTRAWGITRGRSSIKIAIVDEGVDTGHPDLAAKIVTPYDAVGNDNNQQPNSWDGHGTACAGIAAAITDNRRGVAGVAPECRIIPIRIAYSSRPGARWTTNATWIARGIRVAAARGADVISNSWGGGPYNTTIRRAFQYARERGRGGRGCVIISASGNGDRANGVSYPARYPESLACGASNQWDQRKSRTSRDGENWWGSNYGPEIDFLAPGVQIYTTDNRGSGGYNTSGDYYHRFNGTSSATPNAAGVAALVLSVDPALRQWEVRDILRLTARDLGGRGKDNEHGYGRIDALRAAQAASRLWWQAAMRLEFLGSGRECYMRFRLFRLYNSGLNRVRVNRATIRSFDPNGNVIDQFIYRGDPGGVMQPGLGSGGGSGDDLRFENLLLRAYGNRRRYRYSWRANWSYTYWRPSRPITSPSDALSNDELLSEHEVETEMAISVDDSSDLTAMPELRVESPVEEHPEQETEQTESLVVTKDGQPVTISITIK
jgi:subtilisin family serine protease